ncbi:MAG TPA: antitoxin [Beutenbergiaceae bacterium]|nr:antitoxin [Beutenbergiaceae bacterium]
MRTTVTLDSDTEQLVRARMEAKGVSFKQAINDAIRDGSRPRADLAFAGPVYDMGEPTVDLTKATQLAGALEDADLRDWLAAPQ